MDYKYCLQHGAHFSGRECPACISDRQTQTKNVGRCVICGALYGTPHKAECSSRFSTIASIAKNDNGEYSVSRRSVAQSLAYDEYRKGFTRPGDAYLTFEGWVEHVWNKHPGYSSDPVAVRSPDFKPIAERGAKERKAVPIATGCFDYFPDALAAVAELSKIGNDQHNPGEPLHHARHKSGDEADALLRHLLDRGTTDTDGVRHSTKVAWRALALLQKELEDAGAPLARGARHG